MTTIKIGVREFQERMANFLELDTPVAVTRRGEALGVYVPTRRKRPKIAELSELKPADVWQSHAPPSPLKALRRS